MHQINNKLKKITHFLFMMKIGFIPNLSAKISTPQDRDEEDLNFWEAIQDEENPIENQDPSFSEESGTLEKMKKLRNQMVQIYLLGSFSVITQNFAIIWFGFNFHSLKTFGLLDGVDGEYSSLSSLLKKKKKFEYQAQSKNLLLKMRLKLLRHVDPKSFYALTLPFSDNHYEPFLNWILQAALQNKNSWEKLYESLLMNRGIAFQNTLNETLSAEEKALLNQIFGTYDDEKAFQAITKVLTSSITPMLLYAFGVPHILKSHYLPLEEKRIPLAVSIVQKLIKSKHTIYLLSQDTFFIDLRQQLYGESLAKGIDFFQEFIETSFKPALLFAIKYHTDPSTTFKEFQD